MTDKFADVANKFAVRNYNWKRNLGVLRILTLHT